MSIMEEPLVGRSLLVGDVAPQSMGTLDNETLVEDDEKESPVHTGPVAFGIRPVPSRSGMGLDRLHRKARQETTRDCTIANVIWSLFIGSWLSILFFVTGLLFCLTICGIQHGVTCFRIAQFVLWPFGRYVVRCEIPRGPQNCFTKMLWLLFSPVYGVGTAVGIFLSWETVYYIPMAKFLQQIIELLWSTPTQLEVRKMRNRQPEFREGEKLFLLTYTSGSSVYMGYSIGGFEVIYLNFIPLFILALISELAGKDNGSGRNYGGIGQPVFGALMGIFGSVPCCYVIGVCVDELAHVLGLILGSILNGAFLTLVELVLYFFTLREGLGDLVRAAVTGSFLMYLLVIPGVGLLAAGLKWRDVTLNRKSQSISGAFLLLSILMVMFPSVFFHVHANAQSLTCQSCDSAGDCHNCTWKQWVLMSQDPVWGSANTLMWVMTIVMPLIYVLTCYFSLRSHKHIFETGGGEEGEAHTPRWVLMMLLIFASGGFSGMAHVISSKIPGALESLKLSQRFVGAVFYTLVPNAAEYMNAIKFAIHGNIGLSVEIGNQGAILTALLELPALVLMSWIVGKFGEGGEGESKASFTLVFPLLDIFCVIMAVLLRNAILQEKGGNYLTGICFLLVFGLICVVFYFERDNM